MTAPTLARAASGADIQVLGADDNNSVTGAVIVTTAKVAIPTGADIIEINVNFDCFIFIGVTGDAASASTGRILNAGSYYYKVLSGQTHVHFIHGPSATDAVITVSGAE
jgi:hypothetical protein